MRGDAKRSLHGYRFERGGGAPAVMKELESRLNLDMLTVNGSRLRESLKFASAKRRKAIHPVKAPVFKEVAGSFTRKLGA